MVIFWTDVNITHLNFYFKGGNIMNDDELFNQCLSLQTETIIRPIDELFTNLKHPWIGMHQETWVKHARFDVDLLFENERTNNRRQYPIFDLMRLIQFSRSTATKQCIRCGNFTEALKQTEKASSTSLQHNCIYIQDSCADKCLCGGYWVLSPLQ
jgi:hypothetical protein